MEATYFDGHVARGHPAHALRAGQAIQIHYVTADGATHVTTWPLAGVRRASWSPAAKVRLEYGPFPHQYLDVPATTFAELSRGVPALQRANLYDWTLGPGLRAVLLIGVGLVGLAGVLYAYGLPWLAGWAARRVPVEQEVALGNQLVEQIIRTATVDSAQTARLNAYWQTVGLETRVPIRITVIREAEQNAFAAPGGQVVVYTGLLRKLHRHEQLAALLAHETAHVAYRHSLQQLIRSLAAYVLLSAVVGDVGGITAVLVDNANQLVSLSYSRDHETDADAFAVRALARRGIDPRGVVWLMEALPTDGDVVPTLLRTHPQNAERIRKARALARKTPYRPGEQQELVRLWRQIRAGT